MKRVGHLFEDVIAFENLIRATQQAAQGKKRQVRVADFLFHQEAECFRLQTELKQGVWKPGNFRVFEIKEPKPRRISAADFSDRVVHHALCNVLESFFGKRMIYDSWACRKGKGAYKAVQRAQEFSRSYSYVLQCDIRRYFDSVDHAILKQIMRRVFKDKDLLNLLDLIIDHPLSGALPGKGLPIGNLTSQYFANLYLGELDHHLKDCLGMKAYVRYMDDMLVFAHDKTGAHAALGLIKSYIRAHLQLELKPSATRIAPVSEGIPFLGFRVFPRLIRLRGPTLRRFRRRLRVLEESYHMGEVDMDTLTISVQSMIAHLQHADTHRLRQSLLPSSSVLG